MGKKGNKNQFIEATTKIREKGGTLRMSEALQMGISRKTLYSMRDEGVLEQISRGIYRLTELADLSQPDLVTVANRAPNGVICLISALSYHELTTQIPHEVHLAIERGAETPRIDYPPVAIYWFSGAAFREGIEVHMIDQMRIRIYSPEKTIADCFKYRHKIGMDIVLEALKLWREKRSDKTEELLKMARFCRVERVIRPYLEAII
ncbi:MAG: type IV toxin-antitoxin system AbiEi family antitoxin domain-containing protein [Oligoflexus sp.]